MTFLLANIGLKIVLEMFFLIFSKANVQFVEREFVWKTWTAVEALSMTKTVEIIKKNLFAAAALNTDDDIFVVHIASLVELTTMPIHSSC